MIKTNKHRVCTTISEKHWEILKKHTGKFETQQKALEFALENLENSKLQSPVQTPEDELWMRVGRDLKRVICILHKDFLFELVKNADFEKLSNIITRQNLIEYHVVWYYQKPLKELSLYEVVVGIVLTTRMANWLDAINYAEEKDHYILNGNHSVGSVEYSMIFKKFFETLFSTYGARMETDISGNSIFIKVFKDNQINKN